MDCILNMQPLQHLQVDIGLKSDQNRMTDCYFEMNIDNICRVCLEKNQGSKKMCNIFENAKQPHYSLMIMSCASVQIIEGDGLPSVICNKCIGVLSIAWQFKQQCENSDMKLRQYFGSSQHLQVTPDLEGFNIGIKEEQSMFPGIKEEQSLFPLTGDPQMLQVLQRSRPQELLVTAPEPVNPVVDNQPINELKKPKIKKPTSQKQEKIKEMKQHQCDTCGKTFNRREYLTQHIRIHTGEKPYHCHLCGKRFINSGHLTTHMRTHTGEKPHNCTLCPKAFSTRQELNKHTMVHSGERPFVCKLCGKKFGSSSNLYSHLKHHTGEKNFTCEHCGKAFYTKQELKQHFVVHTGEKAFLCEYCNKRFSQIAHLRRHSKLHK